MKKISRGRTGVAMEVPFDKENVWQRSGVKNGTEWFIQWGMAQGQSREGFSDEGLEVFESGVRSVDATHHYGEKSVEFDDSWYWKEPHESLIDKLQNKEGIFACIERHLLDHVLNGEDAPKYEALIAEEPDPADWDRDQCEEVLKEFWEHYKGPREDEGEVFLI